MRSTLRAIALRRGPWGLLRLIAHLPQFARLFLGLLSDPRVSGLAKGVLLGAAFYALSPLDFLSDLLPVVGVVDDLTLLFLACRLFLRLCPRHVVDEHLARVDPRGRLGRP